jgi:type VI secretion system protein ImpB
MAIQNEIPKSRITLTYKTEVDGEKAEVDLPMRFLAMADLSLGTSKDRKTDLDERTLRSASGNLSQVMKDMDISLQLSVPNKIDPENQQDLAVDIPITNLRSFSPDNFAMHIPRIKGLIVLRRLLEQVQSDISNKKKFRLLISELYASEDAFTKLTEELKGFESLRIPLNSSPLVAHEATDKLTNEESGASTEAAVEKTKEPVVLETLSEESVDQAVAEEPETSAAEVMNNAQVSKEASNEVAKTAGETAAEATLPEEEAPAVEEIAPEEAIAGQAIGDEVSAEGDVADKSPKNKKTTGKQKKAKKKKPSKRSKKAKDKEA